MSGTVLKYRGVKNNKNYNIILQNWKINKYIWKILKNAENVACSATKKGCVHLVLMNTAYLLDYSSPSAR